MEQNTPCNTFMADSCMKDGAEDWADGIGPLYLERGFARAQPDDCSYGAVRGTACNRCFSRSSRAVIASASLSIRCGSSQIAASEHNSIQRCFVSPCTG